MGQLVALAGALVVFAACAWALRGFVADDAWITYRYADNLANGHGFVWNPGGSPVEGYSNPLLVGIEAAALWLGIDGLAAARAIGVASGAATIAAVGWLARRVVGSQGAVSAAVMVSFVPGLAFWAVGGLETSLVALLVTIAALDLSRGGPRVERRAGFVLALLPWLRPEGLVVVLAVGLFVAGHEFLARREPRYSFRSLVRVALPALVAQAALEVQRLVVFGHLLPNSAIYKADGEFAAVPLRFLSEAGPLLLLAALGLVVLVPRAWVLAVPVATYLVAGVNTADSVNAFSRFLLPTVPAVAVLAAGALQGLSTTTWVRPRWLVQVLGVGTVLVLVVVVLPAGLGDAVDLARDYEQCRQGAREHAAEWIRTETEPTAVYSISDAGLVPARASRRALDQFWLNDPRLQAHGGKPSTKVRADRLLEARPDVIVLASERQGAFRADYPTDARIASHGAFSAYELRHVASGGQDCRYHLFIHERVS